MRVFENRLFVAQQTQRTNRFTVRDLLVLVLLISLLENCCCSPVAPIGGHNVEHTRIPKYC